MAAPSAAETLPLAVCRFSSMDEMLRAFEFYKDETRSSWRCCKTEKTFGTPAHNMFKDNRQIKLLKWSITAERGISVPFSGIPFIFLGTKLWTCHQGPDLDAKVKENRKKKKEQQQEKDHSFIKRRKLKQDSKKVDCPAMVYMTHLLYFPEYKIDGNKERLRKSMSKHLRDHLSSGKKVGAEEAFYLKLPHPSCHERHPVHGVRCLELSISAGCKISSYVHQPETAASGGSPLSDQPFDVEKEKCADETTASASIDSQSPKKVFKDLPSRKRKSRSASMREKCLSYLKSMIDQIYLIQDEDVLAEYEVRLQVLLEELGGHVPTLNKLPRKNRTP
ncbi:uncharacterized protein LOC106153081 [Lingula anatina]|uniref:Uncharacterized protein LOC106153081 n=1 Tax=Lingula anatina TaxID=7574 RepID=A0A1S3HA32_LINAN|nr:uncharacterized protein LOC106153081 [Lingula anatina]|eukprot:XP_013382326.1 uncharacterized protein LOC106153081 [Lingula anatina]